MVAEDLAWCSLIVVHHFLVEAVHGFLRVPQSLGYALKSYFIDRSVRGSVSAFKKKMPYSDNTADVDIAGPRICHD